LLLWSDHEPALVLLQGCLSLFLHLPAPFPIPCVPFPASPRAPGRPAIDHRWALRRTRALLVP
jgi:hypothetical protein